MKEPRDNKSRASAVILTALGLEYQAVREHLVDLTELAHRLGTIYELGRFDGLAHRWQVALAEVGQGSSLAGIAVERAVTHFNPDVVIFVGVAGGLKDVTIGDVVVADTVYGYESGKQATTFETRMKTHHSASRLVERARVVGRSTAWLARVQGRLSTEPRVFVGAVAAGEKVIASTDSDIYKRLRAQCGDALAVEMEGWGFLQGVHSGAGTQAIIVRGISDLVGDKDASSDLIRQPAAAGNAAAFAFELLAQLDLSIRPVGLEVDQSGAERSTRARTVEDAHPAKGPSELAEHVVRPAAEPTVQTLVTQEEAYERAISVITEGFDTELTNRSLSLAALHGPAGDRVAEQDDAEEPVLGRFDAVLESCILGSGAAAWHVRAMYNITTPERLDMVLRYLRRWRRSKRYEVRAFSVPEAIPLMSPLIVNGYDVLLGVEDRRYYRTGKCLHITGRAAAAVATEYFDALWHDERVFKLRTQVDTDVREITRLGERLGVTVDLADL